MISIHTIQRIFELYYRDSCGRSGLHIEHTNLKNQRINEN